MSTFAALALSVAAHAHAPPPIVNGETTDDFPAVGTLMGYSERYGGAPFCSGTLIHETWVLTAAHCLDAADQYSRYGMDILFVVGDSLFSNSGIEDYDTAVDWFQHPDYSGTNTSRIRADIGLLELEDGLPDIDPVPLNEEEPSDDWRGEDLHYVGWGVTGDDEQDSGRKRYAAIPYFDADSDFIYAYDSEKNLCSGDSGGAGMREDEDGGLRLAGVNSFVFAYQGNTPCVGGASGATRVDAFYDWISEYVDFETISDEDDLDGDGEGSETSDDEESDGKGCAVLPAPVGIPLAMLGLGAALARRRQR
ncbi:MAG: trypsin-like serine protease [Myxococcota bacterium]|nr:trypsin-like serine protease [Myxococcota bacterium]